MTPEQALQVFWEATGQLNMPRVAHEQVNEAYRVLQEAIKPKQGVKDASSK